ncbi:MAG: endonuclease III domain-containing protein, partial [Verrucomicrobiota bacterium]
PRLEEAIRPAGCFRVKADRLRAFLRVLVHECDASLDRLFAGPRDQVRQRLLGIRGIGPETADCLLLYAGGHPSFVIDAYAVRVFRRHGWFGLGGSADALPLAVREDLRRRCMELLALGSAEQEVDRWGDFHAQLVAVGKTHCRPRDPRCVTCPLQPLLPTPGIRPLPASPGNP